MTNPPPNLSIREDLAIRRWRAALQDNDLDLPSIEDLWPKHYSLPFHSPTDALPSVCRCGAWQRVELSGESTECSRSEAGINRYGEPIGRRVCDGQAHPGGDRVLLLADVCGVDRIIVGLIRSQHGDPWIARCELCDWKPKKEKNATLRKLMEHLAERHQLHADAVRPIGPVWPAMEAA